MTANPIGRPPWPASLDRDWSALQLLAAATRPVTTGEVADYLGVHRHAARRRLVRLGARSVGVGLWCAPRVRAWDWVALARRLRARHLSYAKIARRLGVPKTTVLTRLRAGR